MKRSGIGELKPFLRLHGRTVEDRERDGIFFNWTCAGMSMRFTGTVLRAVIAAEGETPPFEKNKTESPWLGTALDGGETLDKRFECEGTKEYILWEAEKAETHTLRLIKLSENARGKTGLLSLETDGEFLPPEGEEPKLRLEFVGDSITCGYGNEAPDRDSPFLPGEENGWMTYATVAARELGADFSCVSVSGISTSQPATPKFPMQSMDELYDYTDRLYEGKHGKEETPWDFAAHPVDAVVVNLGTNDVNPIRFNPSLEDADREEAHFRIRYRAFIELLRKRNGPDTLICCVLGPLDYYLYDGIEKAVAEYRADTGDDKVRCFKLIGVNLMTEGYGAVGHPSMKTHLRMGKELAQRLRAMPGKEA